jgi:hypothetical protein
MFLNAESRTIAFRWKKRLAKRGDETLADESMLDF